MSNVSGGPLPLRDGVNNEENPRTPNSCKNKKKNKQNSQKKFGNERPGASFFLGLCSNSWNWLTGSASGQIDYVSSTEMRTPYCQTDTGTWRNDVYWVQ